MKTPATDKWRAYLLAQARTPLSDTPRLQARALAISRETGAGGGAIGHLVMEMMEARARDRQPWAVFNRELVKQVLADSRLPETLEPFLPEDARSRVTEVLEELLGRHPSSWTLVERTNQTILRLAMAGHVILVGRGAHLVTARLPHVFHLRVIAPFEVRVKHVMEKNHLKALEAAKFVRQGDLAKARYLQRNFGAGGRDPLHFHLTVNTGRINFLQAAEIVADALAQSP
jgi:cytidylate kinase